MDHAAPDLELVFDPLPGGVLIRLVTDNVVSVSRANPVMVRRDQVSATAVRIHPRGCFRVPYGKFTLNIGKAARDNFPEQASRHRAARTVMAQSLPSREIA
jgi:hypothetical protein